MGESTYIATKTKKGGQWKLPALRKPRRYAWGVWLCIYFPELEADDCDWALAFGTLT